MKTIGLAFVIGAVVGIPLTALFGPVGSFIAIFIVSFVISASTDTARNKPKVQPKSTKLSKSDEELITAILPVINSKN